MLAKKLHYREIINVNLRKLQNIVGQVYIFTWGVHVLRSPNFFFSRGMEADRNVKVVGGDVAVL